MSQLSEQLQGSPFHGYTYAYPHKTAYRRLASPRQLAEVWAEEKRDALFLYLHVPFCEHRCGYCNLFSLAHPVEELVAGYMRALTRQARALREQLPDCRFSRLAIGGGTPSWLSTAQLEALFALCTDVMGASPRDIPSGIELSPGTITREKVELLRSHSVQRVSIGIQSFDEEENRWLGRRQSTDTVHRALRLLKDAHFPLLNIDLIYGGTAQTPCSWEANIRQALQYAPDELYLYPLYIRPETPLSRRANSEHDARVPAYRLARDLLNAHGYHQVSQRCFRLARERPASTTQKHDNTDRCEPDGSIDDAGPAYCCQLDGMIGLGPCARSYTRTLHYASEYAVERERVRELIGDYARREARAFAAVDYGFVLDEDEQRRRYLLKSMLRCEGMSLAAFRGEFGLAAVDAFPQLRELVELELAEMTADRLRLTPRGIEYSDTIGPWLYSPRVVRLMEDYPWR